MQKTKTKTKPPKPKSIKADGFPALGAPFLNIRSLQGFPKYTLTLRGLVSLSFNPLTDGGTEVTWQLCSACSFVAGLALQPSMHI